MDAASTLLVIGAAYWLFRARRKPKPRVRYVLRPEPASAETGSEAAVEAPDQPVDVDEPTAAPEPPASAGPLAMAEAGPAAGFEAEFEADSGGAIVEAPPDAAEPARTETADESVRTRTSDEPATAMAAETGELTVVFTSGTTELAEMSPLPSLEAAAPDPEIASRQIFAPEPETGPVPDATGPVRPAEAAVVAPDEIPAPPIDETQDVVAAPAVELPAASDQPLPTPPPDIRSAGDAEADRVAAREIVERFFDGRHARQASWAAVAAILAVSEGEIDEGQSVVAALEQLGIGIEPLPADGDAPPLPDGTVMLFLIPEAARRAPDAMADPDALPGALPVDLRLAIELAAAVASSEAEPDEAGGARPLSFASLVAAVRRRSDLSGVARARALALAIATSSNQAQRGRCGARFGRMALPDREAVIAAAADLIRPEPAAWPGLEASIRRRLDPLILQAAAVDDAQRPERPKRRARPARKATAG